MGLSGGGGNHQTDKRYEAGAFGYRLGGSHGGERGVIEHAIKLAEASGILLN